MAFTNATLQEIEQAFGIANDTRIGLYHNLKTFGCGSIATALDGSNLDHLTSLSLGRSRGSGLGISASA